MCHVLTVFTFTASVSLTHAAFRLPGLTYVHSTTGEVCISLHCRVCQARHETLSGAPGAQPLPGAAYTAYGG